jgi:pimeloyl-ACP methyl ester carboxylesterase
VVQVRSVDGVRLHTEVFGPEDAPPIVLSHGITCAIRVWAYQIADLGADHRVIAFDHRGHGRSGVPPRRGNYSLDYLAADLDAAQRARLHVLAAQFDEAVDVVELGQQVGLAHGGRAQWKPVHLTQARAAFV